MNVHCAGCTRKIGVTNARAMPKVFCINPGCWVLPASRQNEARDDYIRLTHALGAGAHVLAWHFKLSGARIHQILTTR